MLTCPFETSSEPACVGHATHPPPTDAAEYAVMFRPWACSREGGLCLVVLLHETDTRSLSHRLNQGNSAVADRDSRVHRVFGGARPVPAAGVLPLPWARRLPIAPYPLPGGGVGCRGRRGRGTSPAGCAEPAGRRRSSQGRDGAARRIPTTLCSRCTLHLAHQVLLSFSRLQQVPGRLLGALQRPPAGASRSL